MSGFGLGTLMLPVFAVFFPIEIAVGMTAIVHVLNNIFKFSMLYKSVNKHVLLLFGVPGILGAFLGAKLLLVVGNLPPFAWGDLLLDPIKASIGILMIFFALTELFPSMLKLNFSGNRLVAGGLLSGFFGGFSGHQGALRSMFLIKLELKKEVYIATGVAIALLVDATRIPIYISKYLGSELVTQWPTIVVATFAAFVGAWVGKKFIPKITLKTVHLLVGVLMIVMGVALFFNWV